MKTDINFFIISVSFLLRIRDISANICTENQNTHFTFNNFFFENCAVYDKKIRLTDMTKLIVSFRNFAKAPKMNYKPCVLFVHNDLQVKPTPVPTSLSIYVNTSVALRQVFNDLSDPVLGWNWPAVFCIIRQKLVTFIFSSESTSWYDRQGFNKRFYKLHTVCWNTTHGLIPPRNNYVIR
jgi:hypothetical protein